MGLFGLFGNKDASEEKEKSAIAWKQLTTMEQLDEIVATSKSKPIAIFKHSTRCGISRMVLRNFENSFSISEEQLDLYYLDLLSYRDISDAVGHRFQVLHQSPQLLVIKNGTAVAHASHHSIQASELENFI
ncbi:bacillithiol system redox-active protein YtxJ [Patiriisocius hiemis]|uniref:Bacillithiol system redox-active protein YtxJ n=1 Tax=Patiriisocius hiemis TaxID=3075604 RepID=A0ABU2Y969_9FLAO|nr:bacillithiol system redox-active protein YtxJ [Constantimarinum sp. W242]MDT0554562.1 bacillithiol system redox-active protein YtxJ [Constantimarinum sp. W242]